MNLNTKQVLAIIIATLGVLMISTSQLTDLVGPQLTKAIVSMASILNSVLAAWMAVITSQGSTVKDVLDMPGVEHLSVNSQANQTLAQLAVDTSQDKIAPTSAAASAVAQTAVKGN